MIDSQWNSLGKYVRVVADEMGLRDWNFMLKKDPARDDAYADVEIPEGRKWANIRVCEAFDELSREEQRNSIVHELLHLHFYPACAMVQNDLEGMISTPMHETFYKGFVRAIEYGVDGASMSWSPSFPFWDDPEREEDEEPEAWFHRPRKKSKVYPDIEKVYPDAEKPSPNK